MYEEGKGFKSALIGGFDREDVLEYIERTTKAYQERYEKLKEEHTALQEAYQTLQQTNETLMQKDAELLERLAELTLRVDTAEGGLTIQTQLSENLKEQLTELVQTNEVLQTQADQCTKQAREYEDLKDTLAEIEVAAHRRAKEVDEKAKFDAKKLRMQQAEIIASLKKEILSVVEGFQLASKYAERQVQEQQRKTEQTLQLFQKVLQMMDEVVVEELSGEPKASNERSALQRIVDAFQNRE